MHLSTSLFVLAWVASPVLGCLRLKGYIVHDPIVGTTTDLSEAIDNDKVVCSTNWPDLRVDQDGHFTIGCLPGYVYAYEQNGRSAWFKNPSIAPGNEWHINIPFHEDKYCCHGACSDEGAKISCTDYSWEFTQFC